MSRTVNPTILRGIRACVFDAYGTLFDVASAAVARTDLLGDKTSALSALWRDKQLQYTWLRAAQGRHADFEQVTRESLDYALEALQIDRDVAGKLLERYAVLDVYPEVPEVLYRLKEAGFALAILSNGTPRMLATLVEHAGLVGAFDAVISVEEVGAFKPDPRVYQRAVDRLGVPAGQIAFQSSNAWDAYAASASGMRVVWCNRNDRRPERLPGAPDAQLPSLSGLPELLGRAEPAPQGKGNGI